MLKSILLQALVATTLASPFHKRQSRQPSVTIQNGTLLGLDQPQFGQELFLGIPFADPPVRLARPEPLSTSYGERQATEYGPLCVRNKYSRYDRAEPTSSGQEYRQPGSMTILASPSRLMDFSLMLIQALNNQKTA